MDDQELLRSLDPNRNTIAQLLERIEQLERPTNIRDLKQLPMAALKRKLEGDWSAAPADIFVPGSIPSELLAALIEPRKAVSFNNGWRNYGGGGNWAPCAHWKDVNGIVYLEGLMDKAGGNFVGGETVLTLPAGYAPLRDLIFGVPMEGGGGAPVVNIGTLNVHTDGRVSLRTGGAANPVNWVSLSPISFRKA